MSNSNVSDEKLTLKDKLQSKEESAPLPEYKDATPIKAETRRDMRALAFHLVYAVDRFDYTETLGTIILNFSTGFNVEIPEDSWAVQLAHNAIEQRNELDEQIKPLLRHWKFERLGCCTRLILRLALSELNQKDAVPGIIINEAIELAKAFAEKDAYKFINGILDKAYKSMHKK